MKHLKSIFSIISAAGIMACNGNSPAAPAPEGIIEPDAYDYADAQILLSSSCTKDNQSYALNLQIIPSSTDIARIAAREGKTADAVKQSFVTAANPLFDAAMDPLIAKYTANSVYPAGESSQTFTGELFTLLPGLLQDIEKKTGITAPFDSRYYRIGPKGPPAPGCP
jgi:hypothetical protein